MRNELRGKEVVLRKVVLFSVEKVKRPVAGKSRQQQILREKGQERCIKIRAEEIFAL